MKIIEVISLIVAGASICFAFSPTTRTKTDLHSRYLDVEVRKPNPVLTSLFSQQNVSFEPDSGMSKVESSGVKRFTVGYDKLCKSCPTKLQPRVDTLTEMIVGLTDTEREALMENVARRLVEIQQDEERGESRKIVRTARDVYEFQTNGMATAQSEKPQKEKGGNGRAEGEYQKSTKIGVSPDAKLLKKMDKTRSNYESNKNKSARARRLLAVTNALLQRNDHKNEPTIYTIANPVDNGWYHEIDELKKLGRDELKMERLKLKVQKAKYEGKVAKARLKLYGTSMKLSDAKEQAASTSMRCGAILHASGV
mmetsp:Transcript_31289/g.63589  ORF Transcript_31289/g.63589 Transcript_31289/m.63589 type:complete len:310 (-) Transcript_31289:890-1819(-)